MVKLKLFEKLKQSLGATRRRLNLGLQFKDEQLEKFDEDFFDYLEETLIVADVGIYTATEVISELRTRIKQKKLKFKQQIKLELIEILIGFFNFEELQQPNLEAQKPRVILTLGVNGVGKTTTIAKLAHLFKLKNKTVILAAGDTFRAAAVEQLNIWADRVGCKLISHGQGCDPASVVFDAISCAKKQGADFVICDTAGRLHNNRNLMMQLQKIVRVAKSEVEGEVESLLVIDSTMGQNSLSQVEEFKKITNLSGIVLTKLDGTAKGGIAIAIAHEKKVPVKYLGLGEKVADLQEFDANSFINAIFD